MERFAIPSWETIAHLATRAKFINTLNGGKKGRKKGKKEGRHKGSRKKYTKTEGKMRENSSPTNDYNSNKVIEGLLNENNNKIRTGQMMTMRWWKKVLDILGINTS